MKLVSDSKLIAEAYEKIASNQSDEIVFVSYNSANLCAGDHRFIKQMSIKKAAEFFYTPESLKLINQAMRYLQAEIEDIGHPAPYRWYFPPNKEEFISRLENNKYVLFQMDIPPDSKILPNTSDAEDIFDTGAFIVIHKDLNAARVIVNTVIEHYNQ